MDLTIESHAFVSVDTADGTCVEVHIPQLVLVVLIALVVSCHLGAWISASMEYIQGHAIKATQDEELLHVLKVEYIYCIVVILFPCLYKYFLFHQICYACNHYESTWETCCL